MQGALAREARRLFPDIDPASLPTSAALDDPTKDAPTTGEPQGDGPFQANRLTAAQQRELWKAALAKENFWETLDEIEPGALARLSLLARERRWEVIFLTSRPESAGDTAQIQSHRWLTAH